MKITINYNRGSLIEKQSTGYFEQYSVNEDRNPSLYYLRSCAKPLQASLMVDYHVDELLNLSSEEIALCCASHAGESIHVKIGERLLTKFGLSVSDLKCGLHKPISESARNLLLLKGDDENVFHNNCVGKHLLFLALCKINGWTLEDYDSVNHPLQVEVKKKINSLCNVNMDYPITTDGCGVPILSMPLENMLIGFINLFTNPKYKKLLDAFRNNPYVIGGENRLDTEVMTECPNLVAKVGAGGLCIVVNPDIKDAFVVKINDTDMESRRYAVLNIINDLGWGNIEFDSNIYTLHKEVVGNVELLYN